MQWFWAQLEQWRKSDDSTILARSEFYETDKLIFEKFCRWSGLPVPSPDGVFFEQPDQVRVVRDLSTVEDLELMLAMSRYALHLFDAPENLTKEQLAPLYLT